MKPRPGERVDWFRILADLKKAGLSSYNVAERTGIPKATIQGYKTGAEPRHEDGEKLISLWCAATANSRETVQRVDRYSGQVCTNGDDGEQLDDSRGSLQKGLTGG